MNNQRENNCSSTSGWWPGVVVLTMDRYIGTSKKYLGANNKNIQGYKNVWPQYRQNESFFLK